MKKGKLKVEHEKNLLEIQLKQFDDINNLKMNE